MQEGTRVGRYLIESLLGQGGMGRVYRAYDEVLRRRVAVKVLNVAEEDGSVEQTLAEARMAAALEHPNVVAVYDFGEDGGAPYIVMEFVTGVSLRSLVGDATVPMADRVRWLLDVARALGAAHRAKLVHRDVKPENVMVREDGIAKVLDFGIARHKTGETASGRNAARVLGTPAYMAPEQIRGGTLDARVDQFAWGVLAYELVAGHLPWKNTARLNDLFNEVVETPAPSLDAAALGIDELTVHVIMRALSKNPDDRFPSMEALTGTIGDTSRRSLVAITPSGGVNAAHTPDGFGHAETLVADVPLYAPRDLLASGSGAVVTPRSAGPRSRWRRVAPWAALLVVGGGAGAWALGGRGSVPAASVPSAAASSAPSGQGPTLGFHPREVHRLTTMQGCEEFPSLTPDGKTVLFDAAIGQDFHLFALDLATGASRVITHETGWQWAPSVSPDGKQVVYIGSQADHMATYVVPIDASAPAKPLATGRLRPTFTPDGAAVWAGDEDAALRVDVATGQTTRTLVPPPAFAMLSLTELPGGRVVARTLEKEPRTVTGIGLFEPGASTPAWFSPIRLEEVLAIPPGTDALVTSRTSTSENMELVEIPMKGGEPRSLGSAEVVPTKGLSLSRDGHVAVWSTCFARTDMVSITPDHHGGMHANAVFPATEWTDDSTAAIPGTTRFVVVSDRVADGRLWVLDRGARPEPPRQLPMAGLRASAPSVSPDAATVAFSGIGKGLYRMPLDGSAEPQVLTHDADDRFPSFSRDGRTLYFESRATGHARVESIDLATGASRALVIDHASHPSTPFVGDLLGYLAVGDDADIGVPTVLDLHTLHARPLSPALGTGHFEQIHFSADGKRAAIVMGDTAVAEVDVKTGAVLARFDAGADQITGLAYVGDELLATRYVWSGDLWTGLDPFEISR